MSKKFKRLKVVFASVATIGLMGGSTPPMETQATSPQIAHIAPVSSAASEVSKRSVGLLHERRSCLVLKAFIENPEEYRKQASYKTLKGLYNSSTYSQSMMDRAASKGVSVCDMKLSNHVAGVHIQSQKVIGIDFKRREEATVNMAYLSHEFAHYVQFAEGAEYFVSQRSIFENQKTVLAMETSAPVSELIALFVAGQNGDRIARTKPFPEDSEEAKWYKTFRRKYAEGLRSGLEHSGALNAAAYHVWSQDVFKSQDKLDHYNNLLIATTLVNINNIRPDLAQRDYTGEIRQEVERSGRLGAGIDFVRYDDIPETADLFGRNKKMKKLFDAVEWYRMTKIYGAHDARVLNRQNELRLAGNKFVDADFEKVTADIRSGKKPERAFKYFKDIQETKTAQTVSKTTYKIKYR